ncbi:hypothetical protein KAR48_01840 [bacterium]|nr:hypothetical protein [bacterium]
MKRFVLIIIFNIIAQISVVASDIQHGKYGREFMDHGVGARFLAMGSAACSFVDDITAIYWNPAGLASMKGRQFHAMHDERFAGAVNWDFIAIGASVKSDMSLALGFFRSGVDQIPLTRLRDPSLGIGEIFVNEEGRTIVNDPYAYDWINQQEIALVASIGKRKSDKFYYGFSARIIRKNMGDNGAWGLGFDAGLQWNAYQRLWIGVMLSDLTNTLIAWDGGYKEYLRPRATVGLSYPHRFKPGIVRPSVDIRISADNMGEAAQYSIGAMEVELGAGIEIILNQPFSIRMGAFRGDFTVGAGFRVGAFAVDYSFAASNDLGDSHRISLGLALK